MYVFVYVPGPRVRCSHGDRRTRQALQPHYIYIDMCRNDIAPRRRSAVCAAAAGLRWSATLPAQGATSSYDCTGVLISVPNPVVEYSRVFPEYPVIEPAALWLSSCTTQAIVEYPFEYP